MQTREQPLLAGIATLLPGQARFFFLLECAQPVDITFVMQRNGGSETASGVRQGYWFEAPELMQEIIVTSPDAQSIKWGYSNGRGGYSSATLILEQATAVSAVAPVAVAATATVLVAADATRRGGLLMADETNLGRIYVGGSDVTAANAAIILEPGETWSEQDAAAAAWYALADVAGDLVRIQERR